MTRGFKDDEYRALLIVSEVLAGKREPQAKHIEELAEFFHVSPAAFFAPRVPLRA